MSERVTRSIGKCCFYSYRESVMFLILVFVDERKEGRRRGEESRGEEKKRRGKGKRREERKRVKWSRGGQGRIRREDERRGEERI